MGTIALMLGMEGEIWTERDWPMYGSGCAVIGGMVIDIQNSGGHRHASMRGKTERS